MTFKQWWKKHWDEVLFISGLAIAIYFMLKGMGKI